MDAVSGMIAGAGSLPAPGPAGTERCEVSAGGGRWRLRSYLELTALASAVPRARAHARLVVAEWGLAALADPVEQVISELVTNGVRASARLAQDRRGGWHAAGVPPVRLWLHTDHRRVLIEVWDGGEGRPETRTPEADSESGRGLWLVRAISEATGTFAPPGAGGKVVWSMISRA